MGRVVCGSILLAACAIFAAPAAAQSTEDRWMVSAQVGPAFGTFGTTPTFDAKAGYRVTDRISVIGEVGELSHAPFDKAADLAPAVTPPREFSDSKMRVDGYHYNANLMVSPWRWGRIEPYATVGLGAFTGSTRAKFNVGPVWLHRYESDTNLATNVGGGISYRVNRWLGVNGDYRHFIVDANPNSHINRFTTGISVFIK